VPRAIVQFTHLSIQRFATKLPGCPSRAGFIWKYRVELDGMDAGEVETASFHLAQDIAADIVVQAAHESSSRIKQWIDFPCTTHLPALPQIELMQDAN
jgi:hypothetical protein